MNGLMLIAGAVLAFAGLQGGHGEPQGQFTQYTPGGLDLNLHPLIRLYLCVDLLDSGGPLYCWAQGGQPGCPPKPYKVCGVKRPSRANMTDWDRFSARVQFKVDAADNNTMFRARFYPLNITIPQQHQIYLALDGFVLNRVMYSDQGLRPNETEAFFNYRGAVATSNSVFSIYLLNTTTTQFQLFGSINLGKRGCPVLSQ